ncbi:MAG: alpha/beta hydrolase [Clostridia bacterium]|nr:alpha/beta hydrolase [Clostridia bacterium]
MKKAFGIAAGAGIAAATAFSEALLRSTFDVDGNGISPDGADISYPPLVHKLAERDGNLGGLMRMLLLFAEVDGDPMRENVSFCRSLNPTEYTIKNDKGNTLYGWLFKNEKPTNRYMIFFHGYNISGLADGNRYIRLYHDLGFNCFVVDHVHQGKSEGKCVTFGEQESKDCIKWLHFMVNEFGKDIEIVIHGVSMGGATAILTAANPDLPENVKFVVDDCGYSSARAEFIHVLTSFHIPRPIAKAIINNEAHYYKLRYGYNLDNADPKSQAHKIKIPTLLMHGDDDVFVPHYMSEEIFAELTCPKEFHSFKGAPHSGCQYLYPEEYTSYIKTYIDKYLGGTK